jgi:hypothetical protein
MDLRRFTTRCLMQVARRLVDRKKSGSNDMPVIAIVEVTLRTWARRPAVPSSDT